MCGYRQLDGPCPKKYQFIRISDSTGFGDYTETGQVIPVTFRDRKGGYSHRVFLNDDPPIAGGRELRGFPKKRANPTLHTMSLTNRVANRTSFPDLLGYPPLSRTLSPLDVRLCGSIGKSQVLEKYRKDRE